MPDSPAAPASWSLRALALAYRAKTRLLRLLSDRARARGWTTAALSYPGYAAGGRARVRGRLLLAPAGTDPGARSDVPGWRRLLTLEQPHGEIDVTVGGARVRARADEAGLVDVVVPAVLPPGRTVALLHPQDRPPVPAPLHVAAPDATVGVVCDIDDTVMVTALPRPMLAAWHTFVVNEHARSTTPGMPVLYERLLSQHPGAPVIYLSTGAWNVAPTLTRFLSRNLYPAGALLLTDWGPTADRWFRSGREHKRNNLLRLAEEFPDIRWLLVGDDGQHDEAIYSDFLEQHPDHVTAVCIRQLSPSEAVLAGSTNREHDLSNASGVPWRYAPDGAGLAEELEDVGVMVPAPKQPEAPR